MRKLLIILTLLFTSSVWAGDYADGNKAYSKYKYADAFAKFELAAAKGNEMAQFKVGFMYDKGQGVEQDYAQALKWYKLAAAKNNELAQNNIGSMYDRGQGVEEDDAEALKWFKLAAANGLAKAQLNIGILYINQLGGVRHNVQTYKWFKIAADNGNAEAVKYRDLVAAKMTKQQIALAKKLANECQARNLKNCD